MESIALEFTGYFKNNSLSGKSGFACEISGITMSIEKMLVVSCEGLKK